MKSPRWFLVAAALAGFALVPLPVAPEGRSYGAGAPGASELMVTRDTCPSSGSVRPRSGPPEERTALHFLTDVRAGAHECFERAVFEFRPGNDRSDHLGYEVAYRRPPIREDGSGRPVDVAGEAFIEARFQPARDVKLAGGEPKPTYDGPESVRPRGGGRIQEIRHAGSFEGVVTWVIGLDRKRSFTVEVLASPPRLVIDVR